MSLKITDGAPCADKEVVLRGVTSPHWDVRKNRVSSGFFRNPGSSVSRLAVYSRSRIEAIFVRDLHRPPYVELLMVMPIHVGKMKKIGRQHNVPTRIDVVQRPTRRNRSHAEISQGLSQGLAKKVIREFPSEDLLDKTKDIISGKLS